MVAIAYWHHLLMKNHFIACNRAGQPEIVECGNLGFSRELLINVYLQTIH